MVRYNNTKRLSLHSFANSNSRRIFIVLIIPEKQVQVKAEQEGHDHLDKDRCGDQSGFDNGKPDQKEFHGIVKHLADHDADKDGGKY